MLTFEIIVLESTPCTGNHQPSFYCWYADMYEVNSNGAKYVYASVHGQNYPTLTDFITQFSTKQSLISHVIAYPEFDNWATVDNTGEYGTSDAIDEIIVHNFPGRQ